MIREAMELFKDQVAGAAGAKGKVELLDVPGDPRHYMIVSADGTHTIAEKSPPPRVHSLDTIDAVIEYVTWAETNLTGDPTVWFDGETIRVILDDADDSQRINRVSCELAYTPTWKKIDWLGEQWLAQKAFVRLLRITLADAATESSQQLLRVARVLAFSNSSAGHGKVEHGRQSLGLDIEEEVKSEAGEIPDEITLNVRIFDDPRTTRRFEIRLAVDINAREGTFNLCPVPGSVEEALEDQVNTIGGWLDHELPDVAVFRGTP